MEGANPHVLHVKPGGGSQFGPRVQDASLTTCVSPIEIFVIWWCQEWPIPGSSISTFWVST
jgi:hypothetical protein